MIAITLVKVTVLLSLAWLLAHALRNASAAMRHFVWSAALFGCVAIAAIAIVAPPLKVPVPVRQTQTRSTGFEPVERRALSPPVTRSTENLGALKARRSTVPVLPLVWLAGFLGVAVWSVIGHVVLARVAKRATPADGYRISDEIGAPVTCGWREPVILLPRESIGWPEERRRAALFHERAHVVRADFLTQTLARFAAALYWFHPLMWVALRRMRAESEHACDDRVLREGMPASEYATHLLDVAHGALTRRHGALAAVAMARPSQLESRLVAVLDEHRSRRFPSRRTVVSVAILVAVVLLPFAAARPELRASTPARAMARQPLNLLAEPIQEVRSAVRSIHLKKKDDGPSRVMDHAVEAAPGETLTFDLRTGASIDIRGWDEPRVEVHSILGGKDGADSRIEVERAADGVRIATIYEGPNDSHSTSIKLEIRAPRRINVELQSSGGNVTLADLEGTFNGSTGGGRLDLQRLKGTAGLSTGGGDILVADSDLRGSVSTGGGSVKLERVRGGLRGSSGSGPVTYRENERLHIERAGGHVSLEEAPEGASISTGGGDIEVGRASGLVEASTGGGDVRVGPVAGSVHAGTGAGEIEITIDEANGAEQTIHATTGSGRVIINLPAGFDGRFDLETAYTESHRESRIESDWSLAHEPATGWDDSEGTARRYVRARGTAGSGRGWVKVKAVNGDVIVRKR